MAVPGLSTADWKGDQWSSSRGEKHLAVPVPVLMEDLELVLELQLAFA